MHCYVIITKQSSDLSKCVKCPYLLTSYLWILNALANFNINCDNYSKEETIQGRKLLIIRRFWVRKQFKGGKCSREETIRGNTVLQSNKWQRNTLNNKKLCLVFVSLFWPTVCHSLLLLTYVLIDCNCSSLQQCANALKKYAKRFHTRLDQEDIKVVLRQDPCREVMDNPGIIIGFKCLFGFRSEVKRVETHNIGSNIRNKLPEFLLDETKELDLSKLTETLETHSLKSIREKLINVLGNVFAFLKELFRHTKKVFYVVTMCLMITDGYK